MQDIKSHPWFVEIDWADLAKKKSTAPFKVLLEYVAMFRVLTVVVRVVFVTVVCCCRHGSSVCSPVVVRHCVGRFLTVFWPLLLLF